MFIFGEIFDHEKRVDQLHFATPSYSPVNKGVEKRHERRQDEAKSGDKAQFMVDK